MDTLLTIGSVFVIAIGAIGTAIALLIVTRFAISFALEWYDQNVGAVHAIYAFHRKHGGDIKVATLDAEALVVARGDLPEFHNRRRGDMYVVDDDWKLRRDDRFERIRREWQGYRVDLMKRHPMTGEPWRFTCPYHRAIDAILEGGGAPSMAGTPRDWYSDVLAFHRKFGCHVGERPGFPPDSERSLRLSLVREEYAELLSAETADDFEGTTDAIADLIYVLIGMSIAYGIDLRPIWAAVQAANMAKTGGATRDDGKILKPEGWAPPDIAGELEAQGYRPTVELLESR